MIDIAHCEGCPLAGMTEPSAPVGDVKARFMVVTDTPSTFNAQKGRLLSENAMRTLSANMAEAGFEKADFSFVPQIRCPFDETQFNTKQKREIQQHCREHFLDDVNEGRPEAIIPLGAGPSRQVLNRAVKITKVRGVASYSEEHSATVLPLLSPGMVVMYPQHAPVFSADCMTLRRVVDNNYDVEKAERGLLGEYTFIDDLEFLIQEQPKILFFDTENTGLSFFYKGKHNVRDYDPAVHGKEFDPSAAILTMQFCIRPGEAYMLVWDHPENPTPRRNKPKLIRQLRKLLCNPKTRVIGQNSKYDNNFVYECLGIRYRIGGDTLMLAAILDENAISKNQDVLVKQYVPEMAGYADCVHPDTELLMEDLTRKTARLIKAGDRLVGFSENPLGPKQSRTMQPTIVESVRTLKMQSYRLRTESGRCIQVSSNHQMLRAHRTAECGGSLKWVEAARLRVGDRLKTFPWVGEDRSYAAGWMSGILDGEGYVTAASGQAGMKLGFCQLDGAVLRKAMFLFNEGEHNVSWDKRKKLANVTVSGWRAMSELMRLRPVRLISKKPWEGKRLFAEREWDRIVAIEFVGFDDVVSIQTSTHTFIAEGFATHNCFNSTVDKSRMWEVPLNKLIDYGCGDAESGLLLYRAEIKLLKQDERLVEHYKRVSIPGLNTFAAVETQGIHIDEEALEEFQALMEVTVAEQERVLLEQVPKSIKRKHIDKGLKFSRGDFTRDILFKHPDGFRLTPKVFTKTTEKLPAGQRVPSTSSKDHLPYFFDDCPFTQQLAQYVKDERLLGTSVKGFKNKYIHDGLVRPTYSLSTTVTGRTSSSEPNGQNFPKRGSNATAYRRIFIPPPGYFVLEADLSQAELRIAADMANDRTMLRVYQSGGDIHSTTAAIVLGVSQEVFDSWGSDTRKLVEVANSVPGSGNYLAKLNPGKRREVTVKDYYKQKRFEAKAVNFGFCIAKGQQVLTHVGLVPIEKVESWHLVWDGVEWVKHGGVVCRGYKEVVTHGPLTATKDHPVYTEGRIDPLRHGEFAPEVENRRRVISGVGEVPVRVVVPDREGRAEGKESQVLRGGLLGVRTVTLDIGGEHYTWQDYQLCMQQEEKVSYRLSSEDSWSTIRRDGSEVREVDPREFQELQRSRDLRIVSIEREFHSVGINEVAFGDLQRQGLRPEGQRRALLTREFTLSDTHCKSSESGEKKEGTTYQTLVYDLIDAGPRRRFTVEGVLVSNCYGMGWRKFIGYAKTQYGVEFTDEEAQYTRNAFFERYHALPEWHEAMRNFARRHKYVRSYSGRVRHLPMIDSDDEGVQAEAGRQAINCLSDDTEILTLDGWKTVDELSVGDKVYSANPETRLLEEDVVSAIHTGSNEGLMLRFDNNAISALATPQHRWLVDTSTTGANKQKAIRTKFKSSRDLSFTGGDKIWVATHGLRKESTTWTDDGVRLMGWVLTDGYYRRQFSQKTCKEVGLDRVGVTQSKLQNVMEIDTLFIRLGKHHSVRRPTGQYVWDITCPEGARIRLEMPDKTLTGEVLSSMSSSQHRLLFSTMLRGDGCWDEQSGRYRKFCAGSKDRADAFLMLCALVGQPARAVARDMSIYTPKLSKKMKNSPRAGIVWMVELCQRDRAQPQYGAKWVEWTGRVWCPTTKNSTWIAKREGKVFVTGNSPVQGFASDLGLMAIGRLHEDIDPKYLSPIAFVHDAIYCYTPYRYLQWAAGTLKTYMETNDIEDWFGIRMKCPIVADVSFGMNFGDTEELKGFVPGEEYDFSQFWDDETGKGILVPRQTIPPNEGRRIVSAYG